MITGKRPKYALRPRFCPLVPCSACGTLIRVLYSDGCSACVECSRAKAAAKRKPGQFNRWYDAEKHRLKRKLWRRNNPELHSADSKQRQALKRNSQPRYVSDSEMLGFYLIAKRLGACTGIPHHVDHDIPLRGKGVCGLHVPWNLRVIPAVLNMRKGASVPCR